MKQLQIARLSKLANSGTELLLNVSLKLAICKERSFGVCEHILKILTGAESNFSVKLKTSRLIRCCIGSTESKKVNCRDLL